MSGFKGKRWGIGGEGRANRRGYLQTLDDVIKLASPQIIEEVDINGSFEGQIKMLKLMTDFGDYLISVDDQLNHIMDELDTLNTKIELHNKQLLKKLEEIQQEGA